MTAVAREVRTVEVGSVPGTDPAAAVDDAFRLHPGWPSVPELPRRDPLEGIVPRALAGFPLVADPLRGRLEASAGDPALLRALRAARPPPPAAPREAAFEPALLRASRDGGRWKAALIGPVALARALSGPDGRPLSDVAAAADAVADWVGERAFAYARALCALPGWAREARRFAVQLDEPGTTDRLSDAEAARVVGVTARVDAAGACTVVHDCGAASGAGLLRLARLARGEALGVSVDATRGRLPVPSAAGLDGRVLRERVRWILGVVPTDGRAPAPAAFATEALARARDAIGDGPWRSDVWLSPACGLAGLDAAAAARVRASLRAMAEAASA